jgi:indole-3-glycerol phosphate synthase
MYNGTQLSELLSSVNEYGLQALVECYHEEELDTLDWDKVEIVGVNNRNLSTFEVDLHRGVSILNKAPKNIITVSESGLHRPEDILYLWKNGIHSALIGEHFMRQDKMGYALKDLISGFETLKLE